MEKINVREVACEPSGRPGTLAVVAGMQGDPLAVRIEDDSMGISARGVAAAGVAHDAPAPQRSGSGAQHGSAPSAQPGCPAPPDGDVSPGGMPPLSRGLILALNPEFIR